jgi:glutaminyl-tRNA synthetase
MDDTNPATEDVEYTEAIKEDVRWLGFDWGEHYYLASDYFERMYELAVTLIKKGKAYVCSVSSEAWKEYRGVPERPGRESPDRNRSVEENLDLFARMRAGEFANGERCLRARIDMASPNLHLRDPVLYRVIHEPHPHAGAQWCIYPTYDFAHGIEDSIEHITHSICTLEFEVHRPLYDWLLNELALYHPQQIEFARLNVTYTVMSKRKLLELVEGGYVNGWDDPRLPTIRGMRRRGYPAEAIRLFCEKVGITKYESLSDVALLEHCVRDLLNKNAPRTMAVLDPVKLIIDNYPEGEEETFEALINPEKPEDGMRQVPFSRELYIERADFMEEPPPKYFRLSPGREVRLRYACLVTCTHCVKDEQTGEVLEVHATWDPESRGGSTPDNRKVKSTIHWVSARHALPAEVRLYDRLFTVEEPDAKKDMDYKTYLNPDSLKVTKAFVEKDLAHTPVGSAVQFERQGYFYLDPEDSTPEKPVLNRTATLKDSWGKKTRN